MINYLFWQDGLYGGQPALTLLIIIDDFSPTADCGALPPRPVGVDSAQKRSRPGRGMRKDCPVASRLRGGFLRLVGWGTQPCGLRAAWVKLGIDFRVIKNFWKNHAPPWPHFPLLPLRQVVPLRFIPHRPSITTMGHQTEVDKNRRCFPSFPTQSHDRIGLTSDRAKG
ncbi:MAG TPA: hypothetical protein DEQ17_06295 [Prevotella sp.]|nr:hypothetical protein [Prevotella sp.]